MKTEIQKRPYKRNYKCNNPGHINGYTDSPAYLGGKIICQKCMVYRTTHQKRLPTKEIIEKLKEMKLWRN